MSLGDEQILALLHAAKETRDDELDCEGFAARLAKYVEARAAGAPLTEELALVEAHERLCGNCREECAALREALG